MPDIVTPSDEVVGWAVRVRVSAWVKEEEDEEEEEERIGLKLPIF